jgi:hypothetical protein
LSTLLIRTGLAGTSKTHKGHGKSHVYGSLSDRIDRLLLADFCLSPPAAMGSSLPIIVTKRAGQIECKQVVNWSAVFQLVFQLKIKLDINVINQQFTKRIQITPAQLQRKGVFEHLFCGWQ